MANTTNKAEPKTAAEVADQPVKAADEDAISFPLSRYFTETDALLPGIHAADVAGAFEGVKPDTEITRKDARQRVNQWLKSEISTDHQE